MKIQGVSTSFIREKISSRGEKPSINDLIDMRIHSR